MEPREFDNEVAPLPQELHGALTRHQFLVLGIVVEGIVLLLAAGLACWSGHHFWSSLRFTFHDFGIGVLAAVPMAVVFWNARRLRKLVQRLLGPALAQASLGELLIVAMLAGFCEEALFRGVLEPWWSGHHWLIGFLAANLFFGLLHAVTWGYLVLATSFGMYMSLLHWGLGEPNLFRAIVCHTAYDFAAFAWLGHMERLCGQSNGLTLPSTNPEL